MSSVSPRGGSCGVEPLSLILPLSVPGAGHFSHLALASGLPVSGLGAQSPGFAPRFLARAAQPQSWLLLCTPCAGRPAAVPHSCRQLALFCLSLGFPRGSAHSLRAERLRPGLFQLCDCALCFVTMTFHPNGSVSYTGSWCGIVD